MADYKIRVEVEPMVKITWPDDTRHVFSQDDLAQLVYTLVIEGLMVVELEPRGRILREMELELASADDGTLIIRRSGLTNPPG